MRTGEGGGIVMVKNEGSAPPSPCNWISFCDSLCDFELVDQCMVIAVREDDGLNFPRSPFFFLL